MKIIQDILPKGLVVSCQAAEGEPLNSPSILAAMAKSAMNGGAIGIRASGPENISAIKKDVPLPIIGIYKQYIPDCAVYITPSFEAASYISKAGSDIIALDATENSRPGGVTAPELIARIRKELDKPVMADISTYEEGMKAAEWGVDIVATTLAGYTEYTKHITETDFNLLEKLTNSLDIPVIAEGRYSTPEFAAEAIKLGAYAVVVGSAITRPHWITAQFVKAIPK